MYLGCQIQILSIEHMNKNILLARIEIEEIFFWKLSKLTLLHNATHEFASYRILGKITHNKNEYEQIIRLSHASSQKRMRICFPHK